MEKLPQGWMNWACCNTWVANRACHCQLDPVRHCDDKELTTSTEVRTTYETRKKKVKVPQERTVTVQEKTCLKATEEKSVSETKYRLETVQWPERGTIRSVENYEVQLSCSCYKADCGCIGQADCGCCQPACSCAPPLEQQSKIVKTQATIAPKYTRRVPYTVEKKVQVPTEHCYYKPVEKK